MSTVQPTSEATQPKFRVVLRTWENGKMLDEQVIAHAASFEEASSVARRVTGERVRLNNADITASIEAMGRAAD